MSFHINSDYAPNTAGGCCIFCGNPKLVDQKFVLNSDVQIPGLGRLSICDRCVEEAAGFAGLEAPTELELDTEVEDLREQLTAAQDKFAILQAVLNDAVE